MSELNAIQTKHNLSFESAEWAFESSIKLFRVGTCEGQWCSIDDAYCIISVVNGVMHNGHLDDVFEWFEHSCKRDNKNLIVLECLNNLFYHHLLQKKGFVMLDKQQKNCIKVFNEELYQKLLKNGNSILKKETLLAI